jgi:hypothetical protein
MLRHRLPRSQSLPVNVSDAAHDYSSKTGREEVFIRSSEGFFCKVRVLWSGRRTKFKKSFDRLLWLLDQIECEMKSRNRNVECVWQSPHASGVISARMTSRNPWQAAQGAMLSEPRVVEHIILAAFRDAFSLHQPCVPI